MRRSIKLTHDCQSMAASHMFCRDKFRCWIWSTVARENSVHRLRTLADYIFCIEYARQRKKFHHFRVLDYHTDDFESKLHHHMYASTHSNQSNFPSHHRQVPVVLRLAHIFDFDTICVCRNVCLELPVEVALRIHRQLNTTTANIFRPFSSTHEPLLRLCWIEVDIVDRLYTWLPVVAQDMKIHHLWADHPSIYPVLGCKKNVKSTYRILPKSSLANTLNYQHIQCSLEEMRDIAPTAIRPRHLNRVRFEAWCHNMDYRACTSVASWLFCVVVHAKTVKLRLARQK